MNEQQNEELKSRFNFAEWRNRTTLGENLFIWRFFFLGDEFPNWQLHQTRTLAAPPPEQRPAGLRTLDQEVVGSPRLVQSVWRPAVSGPDALLSVDTYECASRLAAHELLIRILGEFQSPLLERRPVGEAGDIAISHPGSGITLFARANQVVVIRSTGRTPLRVTELAQKFDRELIEKPPRPVGQVEPSIRRLAAAQGELRKGTRVLLDVEAAHPAGQPLMYKFFSQGGEVVAEEGRLMYQAEAAGEQPLEVYAVAPDRGVGTQRIQLRVE